MAEVTKLIHKYLRHDKKFPHVWCPGCGIGIMLGALIRAIDRNDYEKDEIVLVSGIGCSGRLPVYVDFNTLHTTHGRALTFATGVKLAKPSFRLILVRTATRRSSGPASLQRAIRRTRTSIPSCYGWSAAA